MKYGDDDDNIQLMKDLEKNIRELSIRGISSINMVELVESNIVKYDDLGNANDSKEWTIKTNGTNLIDILGEDYINSYKTTSNNILEILEILELKKELN